MGSRNKSCENGHSKYGSENLPFISPTLKPQITASKYNVVDHYPVNLAESQERTKKVEQFEQEIIKNGSTSEHGNQEEKKGFRSYFGILLALLAGFVFTVGTVIVVKYMKHYHPFTLAMFRLQGIFVPSIFMVLYYNRVKKIPVFQPIWPVTEKGKGKKFFGVVVSKRVEGFVLKFNCFG
ncbi:unnamed protein product [Orchesella dallaii]|uniref:Uncharacterized protein n=1 Tax=Orchesella dallaii TaxID=48710 RepID=A0ABP1RG65_9HEXA